LRSGLVSAGSPGQKVPEPSREEDAHREHRSLLLALAEEHSPISAILRAAGADRRLMLASGFRKPVAEEDVGFVATSTWPVRL